MESDLARLAVWSAALDGVRMAHVAAVRASVIRDRAVALAFRAGATWGDIGAAVGLTAVEASQWMGPPELYGAAE